MKLPQEFEQRMQDMLGEAYPAFRASYEDEKYQALRVNPHKVDKEGFLASVSFPLEEVAWEQNGYYYKKEMQPGKHPWHEAGVYYIQEPSAMAPAAYLEAKPGERVLDLCAAPGGKTTQIAAYMQQQGLLVCNEIHPQRARILSENVERLGIKNALVTNETPAKLAENFPMFFDRVLVDAPCSGEGMFRKNEEACQEWSLENVEVCAKRQDEILDCADSMLMPGGRLVYSTCTFAPSENECSISRFLQRHKEYRILEVPLYSGMDRGKVEWTTPPCEEDITRTIRLWPHKLKGEGHFLAVLQKGEAVATIPVSIPETVAMKPEKKFRKKEPRNNKGKQRMDQQQKEREALLQFQKAYLKTTLIDDDAKIIAFGEQLYLQPKEVPSLQGLKVLRPGLHLGTLKKDRFEPAHALALYLKPEDVKYSFAVTTQQANQFLQGQTLQHEGEKGWYLLNIDGYSLGWGKLAGQIMKNHYPKGLRKP